MSERDRIETIVERIVGEVLEAHTVHVREEIVRRVTEEAGTGGAHQGATPGGLPQALREIHSGTSQREILRALLDSCAQFAARVALFVVKSGNAAGWQGRGFSNDDGIKDFALDMSAVSVKSAVEEQSVKTASIEQMDSHFLSEFGNPESGEARLLPLLLKDKVAALIYADAGVNGSPHLDAGALDVLVLATSTWLEVNSLRKQAQKGAMVAEGEHAPAAVPVEAAAPAYNDPFAAHAPTHAMAAAAGQGAAPAMDAAGTAATTTVAEAEVATSESATAVAEREIVESEPAPKSEAAEAPAAGAVPAGDQEVQRKAQRFARLLIDEIKLYNQAKVAEGRKKKDLYDRLKDTIEKSRGTYQKRYGNTTAAASDYFRQELIRSLAEDDVSLMGGNFPKG